VGVLFGAGVNRGIVLCSAQSMSDLRTQSKSRHNYLHRLFFPVWGIGASPLPFDQSTWHKMQKIIETGFASLDGCYFCFNPICHHISALTVSEMSSSCSLSLSTHNAVLTTPHLQSVWCTCQWSLKVLICVFLESWVESAFIITPTLLKVLRYVLKTLLRTSV
jgi:hypothetical protein